MKKKELITVLRALLVALIEQEPKPPPTPPPSPPAKGTPSMPAAGHQAYIKADGSLCCQLHDEQFDRSTRYAEGSVRFLPFRRF